MRTVVSFERTLLSLAISSALVAGSPLVSAQEQEAEATALDEVVVTAQRRNENLQDVALSVQVLSGDDLVDKGVSNIIELQTAVPGFTVADYGSANVLNIRGIGRSAVDVELPSGVVVYRDGFPTFPGYFQNEPYYDIAAIEVLRGPQGTFVGKSAAGGAVFIRTAEPSLDGFSGKAEGEVGNYGALGGTLVLNVPAGDTFAFRMAAHHEQRDEPLVDSISGPYTGTPGEPSLSSFRLGALWRPNEQLTAQFRLDTSDLDFGGNITSSYGFPLYRPENNADFQYRDRSWRGVGNVRYTFGNGLVLSSVTGYQRVHTNNNFDRNGSQPAYNRFDSQGIFKLASQEFNLISPDEGAFSYVFGAFVQRTESTIFEWQRRGFNISFSPDFPTIGLGEPYEKKEDDLSAFIDFKFHLGDSWDLETGVRYSKYKLTNDTNIVLGDGVSPPTLVIFDGTQNRDDGDVDGKVSLTYKLSPGNNVFGAVSRAHINGGFNIVGGAPFEPSEVFNYELGWKGTFADGDVRTQTGVFYETLSKYQAQFTSEDLPGQNILKNGTGTSKIWGVEFSLQAQFDRFELDLASQYLNSELGAFPNVFDPFSGDIISITGARSPFSPELTVALGGSYEIPVGESNNITPRLDVSYVAEQNGALFENVRTIIPSHTIVNAGVRYEAERWYADLFVTNALDKRYVAGIQDVGNIWYPGAPRQYGIRVGVDF